MSQASASSSKEKHISENRESFEPTTRYFSLAPMWALYVLTFRQHLHGKRWLVMAILFSLPAGLALLIRLTAHAPPSTLIEFLIAYMLIPHALLPIVALVYAAGVIRDEQEEQTLTYLLIRPIPRWAIYSVKLLATLTTTVLLTTIFTSLTFVAIYVGSTAELSEVSLRCLRTIAVHDLAVIAYCCLFGFVSLFTNWTLVFGIVYTLIFEGLIANLDFGIRMITVVYYCRLIAYQSLPFKITDHGHTEDLAADAWQFDTKSTSNMVSIQTCVTVLLVASVVLAAIASLLCARREFHVKTPDAN
jgi:ABC-2 type transport system permease protein